nr:MAG TPA_asm: hypothetical protein [Caudoviricetes sp.]
MNLLLCFCASCSKAVGPYHLVQIMQTKYMLNVKQSSPAGRLDNGYPH